MDFRFSNFNGFSRLLTPYFIRHFVFSNSDIIFEVTSKTIVYQFHFYKFKICLCSSLAETNSIKKGLAKSVEPFTKIYIRNISGDRGPFIHDPTFSQFFNALVTFRQKIVYPSLNAVRHLTPGTPHSLL